MDLSKTTDKSILATKVGQTIVFKAMGMRDALVHAETTALALGGAEIVAVWQTSHGDSRLKRRY